MKTGIKRGALAAVAVAVESGCGHPFSMMAPEGPAASNLANVGWWIFISFTVIAAIMWALILWISVRRRGKLEEHAPVDVGGGQGWIWIGGFAIPFVILAATFVIGLESMAAFPLGGRHQGPDHEMPPAAIRITGHQWWWQIDYVGSSPTEHMRTANEIHIPVGRPVDIDLTSSDVIHSFFVPALHGKVDLIPGQMNRIRIEASQAGVFRGRCAEYCGAQHAHMELLVVADAPAAYEAWLAQQSANAQPPTTEQAEHGQELFQTRACVLCHTIRGTLAQGRVGPDLTHIASRLGLAANTVPNTTGNLEAWVTHAQSLKPEAVMPDVTEFRGQELRDLTAYLEQLR
jgi:cytochrome c oxidase subunit 2